MKYKSMRVGIRVRCPLGKEGTVESHDKAKAFQRGRSALKAKVLMDQGTYFEEYITNLQQVAAPAAEEGQ
jgi:hypothetical protein